MMMMMILDSVIHDCMAKLPSFSLLGTLQAQRPNNTPRSQDPLRNEGERDYPGNIYKYSQPFGLWGGPVGNQLNRVWRQKVSVTTRGFKLLFNSFSVHEQNFVLFHLAVLLKPDLAVFVALIFQKLGLQLVPSILDSTIRARTSFPWREGAGSSPRLHKTQEKTGGEEKPTP